MKRREFIALSAAAGLASCRPRLDRKPAPETALAKPAQRQQGRRAREAWSPPTFARRYHWRIEE